MKTKTLPVLLSYLLTHRKLAGRHLTSMNIKFHIGQITVTKPTTLDCWEDEVRLYLLTSTTGIHITTTSNKEL